MRRERTAIAAMIVLLSTVLGAAGCGPGKAEMDEIRTQQRQILAKLDDLTKKLEQRRDQPAPQRASGPEPGKAYTLPVGKSPVRGPEAAAVSIVEFSDYQCPFCARSEPMINEMLKAYPTQVNFVYKHMPLSSIHPNAMGAAQAAVAAQRQGKFWEMHELLFANQRSLEPAKYEEFAKQLGLDFAKFQADMQSDDVKEAIREDTRLAQSVQVRGTPTIFVNGKLLQNRSTDGFKQMIDQEIKAKSAG